MGQRNMLGPPWGRLSTITTVAKVGTLSSQAPLHLVGSAKLAPGPCEITWRTSAPTRSRSWGPVRNYTSTQLFQWDHCHRATFPGWFLPSASWLCRSHLSIPRGLLLHRSRTGCPFGRAVLNSASRRIGYRLRGMVTSTNVGTSGLYTPSPRRH